MSFKDLMAKERSLKQKAGSENNLEVKSTSSSSSSSSDSKSEKK